MDPHNFRDSYNAGSHHAPWSLPPFLETSCAGCSVPHKGNPPFEYMQTRIRVYLLPSSKRFSVSSLFFFPFILDISLIFLFYSSFPSWASVFFANFVIFVWTFIFKNLGSGVWSFSNIVQFYFSIFIIFPSLKSLFLIFFFYNWFIFNWSHFVSFLRFGFLISFLRFALIFFYLIYFTGKKLLFLLNIILTRTKSSKSNI